ncbi:MAG: M1 family aminopeptidase, partial [Myxococcota bacterium]
YPFRDLEVAEAPLVGGAGGVEFSSMMTVASMFYGGGGRGLGALGGLGALLGGAGAGGRSGGGNGGGAGGIVDSMLEFVVAHEIAHQWWHGIVGSDARRHPYVDESLAQFSAMLYMEDRYGAERARREGDRQVAANYHMMRLQGGPDGPVDRAASDFPNETAYAGLVYGKGPYFYPAVREVLGERTFFQRLQRYVRQHRFGVAGARSIVDALANGRRSDRVRALARRWLDQSHGDEDLGEADMQQMMQTWMGNTSGIGDLLQGLQGAGLDGDTDEALREVIRQLESIR